MSILQGLWPFIRILCALANPASVEGQISNSPAKASDKEADQVSNEEGWQTVGKKGKASVSSATSISPSFSPSVQTDNVYDVLPQESTLDPNLPPADIISRYPGQQARESLPREAQCLAPDPILLEEADSMACLMPVPSLAEPEGNVVTEKEPLVSLTNAPNSMQIAQAATGSSSPSSVPLRKSGLAAKLRNIDGTISFKGLGPSSGRQGSMQNRNFLLEESLQAPKVDRGSELPRFNHDPSRGVSDVLQ